MGKGMHLYAHSAREVGQLKGASLVKRYLFLLLSIVMPINPAAAGNVQVSAARLEVVYPGYSANSVVEVVDGGYSWLLNPAEKSVRFLPDPLPINPDVPKPTMSNLGFVRVPEMDCSNAYAEFTLAPSASGNALGRSGEIYRGCLYAFQKGFKLYGMVITYRISSTGLGASIIGGISKMIKGSDGENSERLANYLIGKLREKAPDLLVARVEIPGQPIQNPDAQAIKEKIPEALIAAAPASAQPARSDVPPVTPVLVGAAAPTTQPGPQQPMIEARKNLAGMGLTYYDQAQFISAIKRRDDLAVDLYLKAGGIDLAAKDADGRTPVDVAFENGSSKTFVLVMKSRLETLAVEKGPDAVASIPAPAQGSIPKSDMLAYLRKVEALPALKPM